jgi:hypothetical protein
LREITDHHPPNIRSATAPETRTFSLPDYPGDSASEPLVSE